MKKTGITQKGKATFAALLLFGAHHTGIHIGRFKAPDVIIDDVLIKLPLATAVNEAMTFIKKNISLAFEFTEEIRRKEKWQYPLTVIRELLLNAIIHKDYRNPTDVIIKIYDNRIELTNPGSLMGGLTLEELQTDNYIAVHRNKLLAEAFYLRGDIEKYGTGFIRIRKYLADCPNLKLEIIPRGDFIKTVVTNLEVTPQVEKLVEIVDGAMTREELQKKLVLSDREYFRLNYLIPALKNSLIEMTVPDKPKSKNQKYRLTTKGNEYKKIVRSGKDGLMTDYKKIREN